MMAWLLYVTAVGIGVGSAALLAEQGLRRLGRSVRRVWVFAMATTVALPVAAASTGAALPAPPIRASLEVWSVLPGGGAGPGGAGTVDAVLLMAWGILSLVMLANIRLSAWTVRRNERSWRGGRVEGRSLVVSAGFGPGVVGAARPRIVLPEWVVSAAPSLRQLIVLHEVEHVRARDTRLLLAGVLGVALVPWCLPLWWQLHRLRSAIETDCDARVVAAGADPRAYANTLLAVAATGPRTPMPVAALGPRGAELERRIRLITGGPRDRSMLRGAALLAMAGAVVLGLALVPVPDLPTTSPEQQRPAPGDPPGAIVLFSLSGGPDGPTGEPLDAAR